MSVSSEYASATLAAAPRAEGIRLRWSVVLHYLVLLVMSVVILMPLYVMVSTSFKTQIDITASEPVWIFQPTMANYEDILTRQRFDRFLVNSVLTALFSTAATLAAGSMAAFAIARMQFPGRGLLAQTTLLIRMVPAAVLAIPIFALWLEWGIEDGRIGLVLFYTALNLPFAIWLLIGFIKQVPVELEEAAIVDGAGAFQVFFRILFPILRPGLAVASIFTFRIAWNEFILALILTNRMTRTLPVATTLYITDQGVEWGRIMAMGTLMVVPPLLLTFVAARQIIAGLTAGAVKG
ncbi:MAG: carbohydrate ABC transporter permease [Chloroflexi bacterium]|nr:carbohydrate ABC transporter permease [Chloroflexota bacterium]MDL1884974.1 carbohydrate ABC transporter permease [Anaerolineae bacterium CFX8]